MFDDCWLASMKRKCITVPSGPEALTGRHTATSLTGSQTTEPTDGMVRQFKKFNTMPNLSKTVEFK